MSVIELEDITKTFPGQRALSAVSLDILSGEVHCILGQNGCGKSTLIKILSGYHAPDAGARMEIDGDTLPNSKPQDSIRLGLRFVHQQTGVIEELTALENLALGVGYRRKWPGRIAWDQQAERARLLLAQIGRPDLSLNTPMKDARAVDRAAVAIARAIDPDRGEIKFLFLDEPTAALPISEVDHLMDLVGRVKKQGIGVIYVTHRLDEVFRIGDRVTVLRNGLHITTEPVSQLDSGRLISLITGETTGVAGQEEKKNVSKHAKRAQSNQTKSALKVNKLKSTLVDRLDLAVQPGEVVGVAGLDGSGREEVLYALTGAVASQTDAFEINGNTVQQPPRPASTIRAGMALAPGNRQPGSTIRDFSIRENLTLPQLNQYSTWGYIWKQREKQSVGAWLSRFDIRTSQRVDPGRALLSELSGGNQQKVVLAKWLATAPKILLLDEPTSGVDVGAREAIYQVIREQAEQGLGVLIASSDLHDHLAICDRVLIMRRGVVSREIVGDKITESTLLNALMGTEEAANV